MTTNGGVYAAISKDRRTAGWAVPDRSRGIWQQVKGYPKGQIIGADEEKLIFARYEGGWTVLHPFPSAHLQVLPQAEEAAAATAPVQ